MMAAILNSAIFDSTILHKKTSLIHSDSTWWWQPSWIQPLWQKNFTCSFWLNFIMAAILNSAILDSTILHKKKTSLIHSDSTWWWQPSWTSAMLDSDTAILDSDILVSSLRFTQKYSHSTLTLTQTDSIWLKLIHSDSTWWWQPSLILPSWIQPFCTKKFTCSFWLNLMMAAILKSAMLDSDTAILDSDILLSFLRFTQKYSHFTLTLSQTNSIWLKLFQSDFLHDGIHLGFIHFAQKELHSFILTQRDDGSHLELCHVGFRHWHLGFRHFVIFSQIHSKILSLHPDSDSN